MKASIILCFMIPALGFSQVTHDVIRLNDGTGNHRGELQFGLSDVIFENNPDNNGNYGDLQIRNWSSSGYVNTMRLESNGKVGIGTTTPNSNVGCAGPSWNSNPPDTRWVPIRYILSGCYAILEAQPRCGIFNKY